MVRWLVGWLVGVSLWALVGYYIYIVGKISIVGSIGRKMGLGDVKRQ
jgi:hypothetical protein